VTLNSIILQEQGLVPVTGPALVHDFGADLWLKIDRGAADDLYDRLHPLVFVKIKKR